jgi:hypothetical protein
MEANMTYQCPKGHVSSDADYCSECGALIGQSNISKAESAPAAVSAGSEEICPDCGTPRTLGARFCEVCRHDFQDNKSGVAEAIVASQKGIVETKQEPKPELQPIEAPNSTVSKKIIDIIEKDELAVLEKLNVIISVDKDKAASCNIETAIKPDSVDRVFPLDLDENLIGRRSINKGIYPEIEINDPGVSHRHLKFIKEVDGSFAVLELGSSNGTELNGTILEPGIHTTVKAGDELTIGIWTKLKLVQR